MPRAALILAKLIGFCLYMVGTGSLTILFFVLVGRL